LIKQGADGTRGWTEKERTFIQASEAAERLERRRAWQSRALVALLFAAVVAIPLAWWKGAWLDEQAYRYIHVQALTTSQEGALTPSGTAFKECTHCPAMVVVPAGKFVMGGPPDGKGDNQEYPQHDVAITRPFAVAQFEVSWDEWNVCARHGNCISDISTSGWEGRRRPVINVTWRDAQEYVGWLRRITGKHYRLLTEAEWEYAARANETQSTHFPFDDKQLGDYAWYEANSDGQTHPVGEKKLNPFGLGDMHGNVAEWVEDCFHENYNGAPSDGSAWSGNCNRRVIRGGHWQMRVRALRSASREWEVIDKRSNYVGFRVARSLAP
jgi:formylglycine-generating enzyme required for sulfatase activity